MGRQTFKPRQGRQIWRLLCTAAVLALSASPSTATGTFPACWTKASCSTCKLCPYECSTYSNKPACTNLFVTPPTVSKGSIDIDQNLCSDWAGSGATSLGPLYLGGDCSKERLGELYALYNCNTNKVCFKATSCVGKNSPPAGPAGFVPTDTKYACPGVGCGCYNQTQANNECYTAAGTTGDNFFYLKQTCDTEDGGDKTKTGIDWGFTPSNSGKRSGWEYCWNAAPDQVYTIQAHFDATFNGDTQTVCNQKPNGDLHGLQFRTPTCPVPCSTVTKPSACSAGASSATPLSCTTGASVNVFPTSCYVDGTTYSIVTNNSAVTINQATGSFTCPASGVMDVTITAKDGSQNCYVLKVRVTSSPPAPQPCASVTKPSSCQAGSATATTISCTTGDASSVFPPDCYVTGTTYSIVQASGGSIVNINQATGAFTCPASGQSSVTITAKDGQNTCYSMLVAVIASAPAPPPDCGLVTAPTTIPSVCPSEAQATATFTVSATLAAQTITKICPDGSQTAVAAAVGPAQPLNVTCQKPASGWNSGPFMVNVTGTTCTTASAQVTATVLPLSAITVAAAEMAQPAPDICAGATQAVAYFEVTTSDSSALVTYQTDEGCLHTVGSSGAHVVTCTSATNYTTGPVSIKLTAKATSAATCPTPASLTQNVTVLPRPVLALDATTPSVCAATTAVVALFSYAGSTIAPVSQDDVSVNALTSSGAAVPNVTCSKTLDSTGKTINATCSSTNGNFASRDVDFSSVRVTVTGKDTCGTTVATADEYAFVTLGPYLHFGTPPSPIYVCASAPTLDAVFSFSTLHGTMTAGDFTVPVGCNKQLLPGTPDRRRLMGAAAAAQLSVTCPVSASLQSISVSGSLAATSPCIASASSTDQTSVTVVVAPVPVLAVTASDTTVCDSESRATVTFDFSSSQHMKPLTTEQFTVQAKTATGGDAPDVTCTPTVNTETQIITVECELPDNEPLSTLESPDDFASVQLAVVQTTGVDACSSQNFTADNSYTAAVTIQPQPRLLVVPTAETVCDTQSIAVVTFDSSGSQHMAPLTASQIAVQAQTANGAVATGVVCTPQVNQETQIITVQCALGNSQPFSSLTSPTAFAKVQLTVNQITGLGSCAEELFYPQETFTASVTIIPQAKLTITDPGSPSTVCYGVESVSAVYGFSVQNQASYKFETVEGCSRAEEAGKVLVVCDAPSSNTGTQSTTVQVPITGTAAAVQPCNDVTVHKDVNITIDSKPTVSLVLQAGQPKPTCSKGPLLAVFDYSINSNVGGDVKVVATSPGAQCSTSGAPPAVMTQATVSGSTTVTCTGNYKVGDTPVVTLQFTVNKKDCSDYHTETATATATFQPLLCCLSGPSYAALVDYKGLKQDCFADKGTTCVAKDEKVTPAYEAATKVGSKVLVKKTESAKCAEKHQWGFYVKHTETESKLKIVNGKIVSVESKKTDKKASQVQLIAGEYGDCTKGSVNCTKGYVIGDASLTCTADKAGKPVSLTVTVNNFIDSLINEQYYYVGCKAVTACSPPSFGAASTAASCSLGAAESCGGAFPAWTVTANGANGMRTQMFSVLVDAKKLSKSKCSSCKDVVWVVHQTGTYRGSPNGGQCAGMP